MRCYGGCLLFTLSYRRCCCDCFVGWCWMFGCGVVLDLLLVLCCLARWVWFWFVFLFVALFTDFGGGLFYVFVVLFVVVVCLFSL